ncbi:MAG: ATP-binding protein [Kofleriaceae bacterium]
MERAVREAFGDAPLDDPRTLALAEQLSASLAEHDQQIEMVSRLEAYLDRRNLEMTVILDHVAQGFAIVDFDGELSAETSAAMVRWFGEPGTRRVWDYLFTGELSAWCELGFASLRADMIPAEVVLAQLPMTVDRDGKSFRIEYRPIDSVKMLVVVSDITDELARAKVQRSQAELIAILEKLDRPRLLAFVHDTDALVARCFDDVDAETLHCRIHTLKGNCSLVGVASVADACHELESKIVAEGTLPSPAERTAISSAWKLFRDRAARLFDLAKSDVIVVDRAEYIETVAHLGDSVIAERVRRWGQDATRAHLERFAEQARQLARRLGKSVDVTIVDNEISVDRDRFSPLWHALVHAIRNAVDHGIEDDRAAAGKPEHGQFLFRTELRDGALVIDIADDGPGIRIPLDQVFMPGVSTACELTDVSGRGIGMGALRASCEELGGRVHLLTSSAGTTVRCVVPLR